MGLGDLLELPDINLCWRKQWLQRVDDMALYSIEVPLLPKSPLSQAPLPNLQGLPNLVLATLNMYNRQIIYPKLYGFTIPNPRGYNDVVTSSPVTHWKWHHGNCRLLFQTKNSPPTAYWYEGKQWEVAGQRKEFIFPYLGYGNPRPCYHWAFCRKTWHSTDFLWPLQRAIPLGFASKSPNLTNQVSKSRWR